MPTQSSWIISKVVRRIGTAGDGRGLSIRPPKTLLITVAPVTGHLLSGAGQQGACSVIISAVCLYGIPDRSEGEREIRGRERGDQRGHYHSIISTYLGDQHGTCLINSPPEINTSLQSTCREREREQRRRGGLLDLEESF